MNMTMKYRSWVTPIWKAISIGRQSPVTKTNMAMDRYR